MHIIWLIQEKISCKNALVTLIRYRFHFLGDVFPLVKIIFFLFWMSTTSYFMIQSMSLHYIDWLANSFKDLHQISSYLLVNFEIMLIHYIW